MCSFTQRAHPSLEHINCSTQKGRSPNFKAPVNLPVSGVRMSHCLQTQTPEFLNKGRSGSQNPPVFQQTVYVENISYIISILFLKCILVIYFNFNKTLATILYFLKGRNFTYEKKLSAFLVRYTDPKTIPLLLLLRHRFIINKGKYSFYYEGKGGFQTVSVFFSVNGLVIHLIKN